MNFDEWFDVFVDHCQKELNYGGPIDKGSFEDVWMNDVSPEDAARSFVKEMES